MARILLVEDDGITSAILARTIERAGHRVDVASNGAQAIELLASGDVSVLVTDLMMPKMDGQQLCERVRSETRYATLPILLTTGMTDSSRLAWVETYPGVEIISKPICMADLVSRIEALAGDPAD
jgi:DNA-binding response OmpR family regulator